MLPFSAKMQPKESSKKQDRTVTVGGRVALTCGRAQPTIGFTHTKITRPK
jgi:hypothetical protein